VQRRSALDSSGLPAALLKAVPRRVEVNMLGGMMMVIAAALVVIGIWGGLELGRRAETAGRRVGLFASERVVTAGDVIQLRKRGGGNNHRITAHYRYAVRGTELTGQTTLRRDEREKYEVGSPVAVWYLPSEPEASWLDGYAPRPEASWPATVVPLGCGVSAMALILAVRRQSNLLTHGRPAMATVTKVEKKKSDKGTFWRVHYEWTTMSGATRSGRYNHSKKDAPAIGTLIPIVYDRDNTFRHSKYPMPFVRIGDI
jgi:hypothetical protein